MIVVAHSALRNAVTSVSNTIWLFWEFWIRKRSMNAVVATCHLIQSDHITNRVQTGPRLMSSSSVGAYCPRREVRRQLLKSAGKIAAAANIDSRNDAAFCSGLCGVAYEPLKRNLAVRHEV